MDKTYRAQLSKSLIIRTIFIAVLLPLLFIFIMDEGMDALSRGSYIGWSGIIIGIFAFLSISLTSLWAPRGYILNTDGIIIKRIIKDLVIPFENITKAEVMDGNFVFTRATNVINNLNLFGLFGYYQGEKLPSFTAYVSNDKKVVVLYRKHAEPIVISPDDTEDFINTLKNTYGIECIIDKAVNEELVSVYKPFSKSEKIMEYITGALVVLIIVFACYSLNKMPNEFPIHFDKTGNPDDWIFKNTFFLMPAWMIFAYILFGSQENILSRRKVFASVTDEALKTPSYTRLAVVIAKLYIIIVIGFHTFQSGLIALGVIKNPGMIFSLHMLMSCLLFMPLLMFLIRVLSVAKRR